MQPPLTTVMPLILSASTAFAARELSRCGAVVPAGEEGRLVGDIDDCEDDRSAAVILERGATLQLDGHAIAGGGTGVSCTASCTILGPGEIRGQSLCGIAGGRVTVDGVTVHSTRRPGTAGGICARVLTVANSTVRDCQGGGISASRVTATNLAVQRNALNGIQTKRMFGGNVLVEDNGRGFWFGIGIYVEGLLDVTQLISRRNGIGVWSARGRVFLTDSEVTDSSPSPTGGPAVDLVAFSPPVLVNTTCGRSQVKFTSDSWGVCLND